MSEPPAAADDRPIPFLQRTLENIWFLLALGVILPTVVYTGWSMVDLAILPYFGEESTAHGPLEAGTRPGAGSGDAAAAGTAGSDGNAGAQAQAGGDSAVAARTGPAEAGAGAVTGPTVEVAMKNMAFQTETLEITAGTTVTWTNEDPFAHSVAYGTPETPAGERLFENSGDFMQGESFSYTFDEPGTYPIYCHTPGHYQAGMVMTVMVEEGAQ